MTDFFSSTTSNTNPSSSFGSVRYYCQTCQRPFSQIRSDANSTQALCPRCNQYSDEISSRNNIGLTPRLELPTPLNIRSQSQPEPVPEQELQQESQQAPDQQVDPQPEPLPLPELDSQLHPESLPEPEPQAQPESQPESQAQEDSPFHGPASHILIIQTIVDPINGRILIQRIPLTHLFSHSHSHPSQNNESENNNENENEDGPGHEHEHEHGHDHSLGSLLRLFIPLMGPTAFAAGDLLDLLLPHDYNQHGVPPASQEAIDKLEKFNYMMTETEVSSCSVCYEEYKEDETLVRLPCRHEYHGDCVKTWLGQHNSCPMCRKEI